MSETELDVWLRDQYGISRADLVLNLEKIAYNAGFYNFEETGSSDNANAITIETFATVLKAFGTTANLNVFPFDRVPSSVQRFVRRALQKAIAVSLRDIGKIKDAMMPVVYGDKDLTGILEKEFPAP